MSDLRNRGQYDQAVREEFEHLSNRIAELEVQLDALTTNEEIDVGTIVDIHYGDIAVNNGNTTGSSTFPRSFPKAESTLHWLGQMGAGGTDSTNIEITLRDDGLHADAERTGNVGDGNVSYMVVRHRLASSS